MKIAVVGAGGIGGYFGGVLAQAGQDVTFIARGPHLKAIREKGLQVNSVHGDFRVKPARATADMGRVGPVDLVLVCVKDYQLDGVLPGIASLVGDETAVIPLLNGVRSAEQLVASLGQERVLGGLCRIVSFKEEPGVIRQASPFRQITFGEWSGQVTPRTQRIRDLFQSAGIEVELAADIRKAMWTKFLFITAYSGVASVVRLPAAGLRACPETMEMLRTAMEEIEVVARARGTALDDDVVDQAMAFVQAFPPEATASMQRDVAAGRMFELEAMTGSVVRYGAELGLETPVNRFLYAALKPLEIQARDVTSA